MGSSPPQSEIVRRAPSFLSDPAVSPRTHCQLLAENIIDVVGLASNSRSATDTWLVVLYDPKTKRIITAFMKFFMHVPGNRRDSGTESLEYEMRIYSTVVKPLIERGVNTHFVYTYDASNSCTFGTLAKMLASSKAFADLEERTSVSKTKLAQELLERNMLITQADLFNGWRSGVKRLRRPAVTNPKPPLDAVLARVDERRLPNSDPRSARYGYVLNESMGGAKTVADWLDGRDRPWSSRSTLAASFQIVTALTALSYCRCSHNDTHLGNVYLAPGEKLFEYVIGETRDSAARYFLRAPFSAKLYDFDLAYCERLGPNPTLDAETCEDTRNCNVFYANRDTTKFANAIFAEAADIAKIPMFDAHRFSRLSDREKAHRASAFPKSKIPHGLYAFVSAFANTGHESADELVRKTNALISAFMTGTFLTHVAVLSEDYSDPIHLIGLRDLPSPERVLSNLADLILAGESHLPPPSRSFWRGEGPGDPPAFPNDDVPKIVSVCTRDRFNSRTGELLN